MDERSLRHQLSILVLARGCLARCDSGNLVPGSPGEAAFINDLVRGGAQVTLCGPLSTKRPSAALGQIHRDVSVRIVSSCTKWRYLSPRAVFRLVKAMREADYLYLWTGSFAVYVAALNHFFAQKPYAVYEQPWMDATYLATYLERQGPIVRWLLPRSMRRARERMIRGASHVYVHGGKLREECRAIRGEEVLDVVPLTPVRRTDFYERAPTFPSQVRRIAFVGGVVGRGKGVEVLLDALRDLKSRGVPFEFRSATKVPFTESQTKQLAGLELGDAAQIHVGLKWDPDLRDLLRQSDILVVASWSEGFPRVIYEAGSQGLALVTTPVGGIPYALKDNHDALFVAPGGASALADALERLARQPTLVHQLGRNLQRTVWSLLFEASDFESHGQQVIHWAQSVARQRALDTDRA